MKEKKLDQHESTHTKIERKEEKEPKTSKIWSLTKNVSILKYER